MNSIEVFEATRDLTISLCEPLELEDYTPQSADFASPPKWHLAHTTWFFEQMILIPFVKGYQLFNSEFSFLFNSYYNTLGKRIARHERGLITRPSVDEVYKYRAYVNEHIKELLSNTPNDEAISTLVTLGINHEQQHQELLITDIKYTLSRNPIHPKLYDTSYANAWHETKALQFIKIKEGIYNIGYHKSDFCFDNELGHHRVFLEDYAIANRLVTNREYLEFIEAAGYNSSRYWLDDGWHFVTKDAIAHPLYWEQDHQKWYVYTLAGRELLNLDAPVTHISFYEANAYANFRDKRLATEFEWEVANSQFNWGTTWEWTNSAYLPYPNFKQDAGAVGEYNGKFMINLMVLKGRSVATSPNHSRPTYRNFFRQKRVGSFQAYD